MPITLHPLPRGPGDPRPTRRRFLRGAAALAAAWSLRPLSPAALATDAPATDPDRFALLSDIHVAADPKVVARGVNMFDNLRRVCDEVTRPDAAGRLPAAGFIDGDLAFQSGEAGDYETVLESLRPLRRAGLPVHLTMGNHDDREHFWKALPDEDKSRGNPKDRPVEGRQAMAVASARANWFVLDSLERTTATPGRVGKAQLEWLAGALDAATDKPALVMVHHDPTHATTSGLRDTPELMEVIRPRRQVKALLFGHTHEWGVSEKDGLHRVNFPPVGYVFGPGRPIGWVEATLGDKGMTLHLHCLDPKHPEAGRKVALRWRG